MGRIANDFTIINSIFVSQNFQWWLAHHFPAIHQPDKYRECANGNEHQQKWHYIGCKRCFKNIHRQAPTGNQWKQILWGSQSPNKKYSSACDVINFVCGWHQVCATAHFLQCLELLMSTEAIKRSIQSIHCSLPWTEWKAILSNSSFTCSTPGQDHDRNIWKIFDHFCWKRADASAPFTRVSNTMNCCASSNTLSE